MEVTYDGSFHMQRSAYGGNARAIVSPVEPAGDRDGEGEVQEPLEQQAGRTGRDRERRRRRPSSRTKVLGQEKAKAEGIRLEDARIVVSGGRGLGSPDGFKDLEELADALGGATGASRAACDLGWYPPSKQVGLTGTTVSPTVYVAVAISGASQHMAGMSGAKNIIAINKDPDANMVKVSRFAVDRRLQAGRAAARSRRSRS